MPEEMKVIESFKVLDSQGNTTYEATGVASKMSLSDVIKAEIAQLESKKAVLLAQLETVD